MSRLTISAVRATSGSVRVLRRPRLAAEQAVEGAALAPRHVLVREPLLGQRPGAGRGSARRRVRARRAGRSGSAARWSRRSPYGGVTYATVGAKSVRASNARLSRSVGGCRSAAAACHARRRPTTWSPERMSLTSSGPRRRRGTRRTGCRAARRTGSACRTSPRSAPPRLAIPRRRSACAIRFAAVRSSSLGSATSTQVGTFREIVSASAPKSRPSSRVTPIEMPTPGKRVAPEVARLSYRPPEQIEPNFSYPSSWVS